MSIEQLHKNKKSIILNIIIAALLLFIAGTLLINSFIKNTNENLNTANAKISVLIDEVGKVKNDNQDLKNYITNQQQTNKDLLKTIDELTQKNSEQNNSNQNSKDQLSQINTDLLNLKSNLQYKEQLIAQMNKESDQLKEKIKAINSNKNRKNYLILGENNRLVDTIILASVDTIKNKVYLVSIPRDLYYNGRKVNEIYEKFGIQKAEKIISEITGLNIDHYAVFNFESLKNIVDAVGGIQINVPKEIVDKNYPAENNAVKTVTIAAGDQLMTGEQALIYARSRKSTSDFDRSNRQQQVIKALINKFNSLDLANRLDLGLRLYGTIQTNIKTDLDFYTALGDYSKYKDYQFVKTVNPSSQNVLLSSTSSSNQYILIPKDNDYFSITKYIYTQFEI